MASRPISSLMPPQTGTPLRSVAEIDRFTTALRPEQEQAYQAWRAALPADLQNEQDYDLRGAFLASAKANGRLHMTDQFKKPNHVTFSDGSQYSNAATPGGRWVATGRKNAVDPTQDEYVFFASPENARHTNIDDMASYFVGSEPGNYAVYSSNYKLPRK